MLRRSSRPWRYPNTLQCDPSILSTRWPSSVQRTNTHTVLTGTETRQSLYVALSRGRDTNHLYLGTPAATLDDVGPEVQATTADPREVLTGILARDGRALSATTTDHGDPAHQLRQAVLAYQDALPVLAQNHLGPDRMTALDHSLEQWLPGLTSHPAYPHLRGQLAVRWADGDAPHTVLKQATWLADQQSLTDADDPAAVLTWRLTLSAPPSYRDAPLTWLPDTPTALRDDPVTDHYLTALTDRVTHLKDRVATHAQQAGAADREPWQRVLSPGVDEYLVPHLAIWRAAHGIPPTDPTPTGPPMKTPEGAKHQDRLNRRLTPPEPYGNLLLPDETDQRHTASPYEPDGYTLHMGRSPDVPGPSR